MDNLICAACGREMSIYEGVLSWRRDGGVLSGFTITHRDDIPAGHNAFREVFRVASVNGYMAFVQYLLTRWGEGYVLDHSLRCTMEQLSEHIHERLVHLLGE
ncbi:hypothetical protein [Desulfotomaculum copahuensis]|uniref:Uncharacterized protein n=1 Tax=Desulfotomaculum copahuensis TaxID=1838280 RepID=A0A1B7LJD9_9FIRM|nr:hypothetical protein [Desulfotomaculum copahuensis]OAT86687.1 hypothetical protein A6M21_02370 [Desulfotomaculum copahuensis]